MPLNPIPHVDDAARRAPGDLLQRYGDDTPFALASARRTLLAQGTVQRVVGALGHGREARELLADARQALRHAPAGVRPVLVGALPFDRDATAVLRIPQRLWRGDPVWPDTRRRDRLAKLVKSQPCPTPEGYAQVVRRALERLRSGAVHKVVLSRALDVELSAPLDIRALLGQLARRNPDGYTFAVDLPAAEEVFGQAEPRRVLVGASPELLVSRSGRRVVAHPLAGSVPRSRDPIEDMRRRDALLRSDKDRREHAIVVHAVARALAPLCGTLRVPGDPVAIGTPTLWHLATRLEGEVAEGSVTALHLAAALHPTPAVCGEPASEARALIGELESHDRGCFTGAVGWCDAHGDGEWIVAIRCAEIHGRHARLHAGAGIVEGSEPEAEVTETAAKLQTMLDALAGG